MKMTSPADYSALNWVKSEIDETLNNARHTLEAYVANPQDISQMRFCIAHLHQVRGTLQMIELYGAVLLAEEMELLARWLIDAEPGQKEAAQEDAYEILMRSILQLPNYLERLQKGHVDNPVVMLPLLNELRAVRSRPLLSESMLFAPDLSVVPLPASSQSEERGAESLEAVKDVRALARKLRPAYQQALLNWYRNHRASASLERLAGIVEELQQAVRMDTVAQVWWVAGAFMEALAEADTDAGGAAKQLLGQIDREIKRLIDSGEETFAAQLPKDLIRNLLYYIGRTRSTGARVTEVRQAFRLDALLLRDQEMDDERARLTGPNRELMRTVSTVVREDIAKVKDELDIFVRSETQELSALLPLEETLRKMADTLGMLGLGAPRQLILDQMDAINVIVRGTVPPEEATLMGIAGALLQAESALLELDPDAAETATEAGVGSSTGRPSAEYREMQQAVIREAQADISRIKDSLMAFFGMPQQHDLLADVPRLLQQVSGGLSILSLTRATEVLQACQNYIVQELIGHGAAPSPHRLDALTEAISALEYYLEALGEDRAERDTIIEQALARVQQLSQPEAVTSDTAAVFATQPQPGVEQTAAPAAAQAKPARMEEIDDEIIEVFLEEAGEETASINIQLQRWKENTENGDALHTLRRSFHTLKGSGRLVGAAALGEFAWSLENLLNRVIDNTVSATPELIVLVEEAAGQLPGLVESFKGNAVALGDIAGLMQRAHMLSQPQQLAPAATTDITEPVVPPAQMVGTDTNEPAMDPVLLDIYSRETTGHLTALRLFMGLS